MVDFKNSNDVERWLKGKPREVAVIIAARSVLRAVPWLETHRADYIILATFRALAAPWAAAAYPAHGAALCDAARAASAYVAAARQVSDVAGAAYAAAKVAFTADAGVADAAGAAYAFASSAHSDAANARAASGDADAIEQAVGYASAIAAALALRPLWPDGEPKWASKNWKQLNKALLTAGEDWEVWTDWYEARLRGGPANEALEVARVMIPDEIWDRGPAVVNARIKELIEKHSPGTIAKEPAPSEKPQRAWDFFLSYSKQDDPFARWIESLLSAAGFRVFVQFKHMPAGSNFVREMQRGLEKSARFVALLSPDYVKSDHCQAEWSAAYNADPSGERRKLVPFLIRPAELPPLAKQIVYTPLVGLSPPDVAAAVLRSAGYQGALPTIPPGWPIGAAIEQMRAAAGGVFDVAPDPDGLLQRKPSAIRKSHNENFTPEQLFYDFAREVSAFAEYTCKAKGNFSCSDRLRERAAKLQRTVAINFFRCDELAINKNLVWVLRVLGARQG